MKLTRNQLALFQAMLNIKGANLKTDGLIGPATKRAAQKHMMSRSFMNAAAVVIGVPSEDLMSVATWGRKKQPATKVPNARNIAAALPTREEVKRMIRSEAKRQGVNECLALTVAQVESSFDPAAKSDTGAYGVFQLTKPACADVIDKRYSDVEYQKSGYARTKTAARQLIADSVEWNIRFGVAYIKVCSVYATTYMQKTSYDTSDIEHWFRIYANYNIGVGSVQTLMQFLNGRPYESGRYASMMKHINDQSDFLKKGAPGQYLQNVRMWITNGRKRAC